MSVPEKHETEKLHVLEPTPSHVASFLDFPNQRTAFYLQTEKAPHPEAQKEKYVRKYDTKDYCKPDGLPKMTEIEKARVPPQPEICKSAFHAGPLKQ